MKVNKNELKTVVIIISILQNKFQFSENIESGSYMGIILFSLDINYVFQLLFLTI